MPQMSPMSWVLLMTLFLMTMMLTNNMIYFTKEYKNKTEKILKEKKTMKWMW